MTRVRTFDRKPSAVAFPAFDLLSTSAAAAAADSMCRPPRTQIWRAWRLCSPGAATSDRHAPTIGRLIVRRRYGAMRTRAMCIQVDDLMKAITRRRILKGFGAAAV